MMILPNPQWAEEWAECGQSVDRRLRCEGEHVCIKGSCRFGKVVMLPTFKLPGEQFLVIERCKYFGLSFAEGGPTSSREMDFGDVRALATFQ
eukprot:364654-Chlamydomonas_euryale.AAC.3